MKETPLVDRVAAKLNTTSIGRGLAWFFQPFAQIFKWSMIILSVGYAFFWLFVPTLRYNVRNIQGPGPKPTDCDFMTAPLGNKGCHYEMQRVLIDAQGNYIASVNWFNSRTDGKRDDPNAKPQTMVCSWEKVQE
jgi:hypothetical protein